MLIAGHEIKVIAGDDGKVWLCMAVASSDIESVTAAAVEVVAKSRALFGKVRTAEVTRFRQELGKVA